MEKRKVSSIAILLIVSFIFVLTTAFKSHPASPSDEFITWEELSEMPGPVKGYGLTVFKGMKVEKFEVEFDGVVPHPIFQNEKMILVRMGAPLIGSQVLAGMSGSPVYFMKDGKWKLAGAIAFGFKIPTAGRSLGGITPIRAMLGQRKINFGRKPKSTKEFESRYAELRSGNLNDPELQKELAGIHSQMIKEMSEPVTVGSYNGVEVQALQPLFSLSLNSLGKGNSTAEVRHPKPGDAVTMMLADGDVKYGGTCTVTYVTKTKFWACGHPILMDGPMIVPARMASIATSYKGPFDAFKMVGDQHESAGYISYDGMFAIEGVLQKAPKDAMLPVRINADVNGQKFSINYQVFRHKMYSEALIAQIGSQMLEPVWNPNRKATIVADSKIYYDNRSLNLYGSSSSGPPIMFGPFMIMSNPWAMVTRTAQMAGKLISSEWNFDVKKIEMNVRLKEGEGALQLDNLLVLNSKNQAIDSVSSGDEIKLVIPLRTNQGKNNALTVVPMKIPEISDIKPENFDEDGPAIVITVESGNRYNERDEKKIIHGIPESKKEFIDQLMVNERDPQKIYVQMILPPTKVTTQSPKKLSDDYRNSWRKVPTLKFLKAIRTVERKIVRAELDPPEKNSILNIDGSIRLKLKLPKPPTKKVPVEP